MYLQNCDYQRRLDTFGGQLASAFPGHVKIRFYEEILYLELSIQLKCYITQEVIM